MYLFVAKKSFLDDGWALYLTVGIKINIKKVVRDYADLVNGG